MTPAPVAPRPRSGAVAVAAGILLSRVFGLARQRVVSHFLGVGDAADALSAALRIPNVLQNLLGEGVLSASFVPVYARLRAEGREEDAGRLARTVFAALALVCSLAVLVGIALAPAMVTVIAGGFASEKREFTVGLVRLLFPGIGLLVMSAWCLGVLNSHRKFFISYSAPVIWNVAIIATLLLGASQGDADGAARLVAVAAVLGSLLQFAVQLPWVVRALPRPNAGGPAVSVEFRRVVANFLPVVFGRGVVQVSAWLDTLIASWVMPGATAVLLYAQNISMLPVSVFGMSVSASELTEMSGHGAESVESVIRERMGQSLRTIAFFVVPSSATLLVLGDVVAGAILQTGRFQRADTEWVWAVLAGSAIGLLAGTMGRLYNSAWYALHDTATPVKIAMVRVTLTASLGAVAALLLPGWLAVDARWGVAGLTATAGMAAWVEYALLRAKLNARIGHTGLPRGFLLRVWSAAGVAAGGGYALKLVLLTMHPVLLGVVVLGTVGIAYFGITHALGITESAAVVGRLRARLRGPTGPS